MRRHRLLHACLLLVLVLILASCAEGPLRTYRMVLPEALTRCQPEPPLPAEIRDDLVLIEWVEGVRTAGQDCREVVARVREINEELPRE